MVIRIDAESSHRSRIIGLVASSILLFYPSFFACEIYTDEILSLTKAMSIESNQ